MRSATSDEGPVQLPAYPRCIEGLRAIGQSHQEDRQQVDGLDATKHLDRLLQLQYREAKLVALQRRYAPVSRP